MGALVGLFSKLIAYVLLWEQQSVDKVPQGSYERLRHDISMLLQEQESMAAYQGVVVQHFLAARLAVLSWIDELVLRHKAWPHHERWQILPLQFEYYGPEEVEADQHAALQKLFSSEPAVREVYALCLSLGFSGRRGSSLTDRLFLTDIESVSGPDRLIQREDVWKHGFKLTPQPYEDTGSVRRPWRVPLALTGLLCGAVVLVGLWSVWRGGSPACVPSPGLLPTIQQRLAEQPCSRVTASVQGCTVTLAGRLEHEAQRATLRSLIQGLQGVQRLDDAALRMIPQPFCQVLGLFEPLSEYTASQSGALRVRPNKDGELPLYTAGEDFTLEVTTPELFASYLYVDFYGVDGRVRYLYSNPMLGQPFAPGSRQTLGLQNEKPIWGIGPPYGRGLVTVIASKTPLIFPPPDAPYAPGSIESYLAQLRQALMQESARTDIDVAFFFIETKAK